MWDERYWKKKLREAEREFHAATRLADLNEAAQRYLRIEAGLKRLDAEGQPA